jgi:uncharacterized protein (TIGR02246 family)
MSRLSETDLKAIDSVFQAYGAAWGQADAAGCASLFAADGDAIAADGALLRSPAEIKQYYEKELSGKYAGVTMTDFTLDPVRALSDNVALMNVSWRLNGVSDAATGSGPVLVRGTFVVRREGTDWRFVAVRFMVPFRMAQDTSGVQRQTA